MDFMMWATRSLHVFAAVVWLGGLLYMGGVLYPVLSHEKLAASEHYVRLERRFIGFVWMCVWTIAITGVFLALFSPHFVFGRYRSEWDYLLVVKEALYGVMIVVATRGTIGVRKMEGILRSASPDELEVRLLAQYRKMVNRRKVNLALGIIVLLLSTRLAAQ